MTRRDRWVVAALIGVPAAVQLLFVWLPAAASVALSFTSWDGIGGLERIEVVGLRNYADLVSTYPPFWPALLHNAIWLAVLGCIATPLGILFAVLLDRNLRGTQLYQGALFLPVVLSMALVGFIWELQYAPEQGFLNNVLGRVGPGSSGDPIDFLGDRALNLWAVLVAASWKHVGYVMVLYLAALRSVDPALREAAELDGAGEWATFQRVTFPVLRPMNVVIVVITIIEALRAFDIVYVINRGLNGLELLSVLVTNAIIGETSRVGFGSAIATVLLALALVPIGVFVWRWSREDAAT